MTYEVWSDTSKELAITLGAAESERQTEPERRTYLIDENGYILVEYSGWTWASQPAQVLKDAQLIWGDYFD